MLQSDNRILIKNLAAGSYTLTFHEYCHKVNIEVERGKYWNQNQNIIVTESNKFIDQSAPNQRI